MCSIPFAVLIFSFVKSSFAYSWTRSNLENDKLYKSEDNRSPGDIQRVQLKVTAANVTTQPSPQLVHVFYIRWTEIRNAAAYRVHCEANTTNEVITLLDRIISDNVTELNEKFILPQGHLSLLCAVTATNSFGTSNWTYSPTVTVNIIDVNAAEKVVVKSPKTMDEVDVEKLALNQLLQLIHASHLEDLPPLPITRNLKRPTISGPNTKEASNSQNIGCLSRESTISHNAKFVADLSSRSEPAVESIAQFPEMDYNEDQKTSKELDAYDTLEEDLRLAIGADKTSQEARRKSLELFGISDRVL